MHLADLFEVYSEPNSALRRYLSDPRFDYYDHWDMICRWIADHDLLDEVSELAGEPIESSDELEDIDPEIFQRFPQDWQRDIVEDVTRRLRMFQPEELSSHEYFNVRGFRLLPRGTWLIHFSDQAETIAEQGFTVGMDDMTKLGLTTYFKDSSSFKKYGGYNFAFLADSRDARDAAAEHKYGRHAVMFQNSGVHAYHSSDEEDQVIFWGKDVDPRTIVFLRALSDDDWAVVPKRYPRGDRDLFKGQFEAVIQWVMQHAVAYRRHLYPSVRR